MIGLRHGVGSAGSAGSGAADVTDVIEAIGRDHALAPEALALPPPAPHLDRAWDLYVRQWQRFCGTGLDPLFARLDHPAVWAAQPISCDASPVVVVGTGPSLRRDVECLRTIRDHVQVFTSPRGADALAESGLTPDLVLIEHQTALDAQFTAHAMADRPQPWRQRVPFVAAEARTPAALLDGLAADRVFVVDRPATWGLWPATAVALAQRGGAPAIALVGIDLGSRHSPDPRQRPLCDLLALLATAPDVVHLDAGDGAVKPGWMQTRLTAMPIGSSRVRLDIIRRRWPPGAERLAAARDTWLRLAALAADAERSLDAAGRARDGDPTAVRAIEGHLRGLLDAGAEPALRTQVQDGLGCAFLPRYWRTPPDGRLGSRLWRPLALASHELVEQHRALGASLRRRGVVS